MDYLTESGHDRYFEKVLNAFNEELSIGSIAVINEAAILEKLPKQPTTKTKLPTNLGQIRQLHKITELFDMILPVIQLRSGGNMITQKSKEDIVLRTMRKFAGAEDGLSENKVVNFILTIKGEYTNSGSLDQRYQN